MPSPIFSGISTCGNYLHLFLLCILTVTHGFPTHEPKSKSDSEAQSMPRQAPPSRGRTPGGNLSVGRGEGGILTQTRK